MKNFIILKEKTNIKDLVLEISRLKVINYGGVAFDLVNRNGYTVAANLKHVKIFIIDFNIYKFNQLSIIKSAVKHLLDLNTY